MRSARSVARCAGGEPVRRALIATLVAGLAASAAHAQAPSLRLVGADGDVAVEGMVLGVVDDVTETRVVVYGDTLTFAAGSPFFRAGGAVHALALPARRSSGTLYLPEQFFLEWLPRQHGEQVAWRSGALRTTTPLAAPGAAKRSAPVTRVVVIDPGHGGRDAGKIGPNGVREKDVVLAIGLRLRDLLTERGYEVYM